MRVIGIDPGLTVTGFGVVDFSDQIFTLIDKGEIKLPSKLEISAKLSIICNSVGDIIKRSNPEVMAIEDVFVSINTRTALKLGQAKGAAILSGTNNGLRVCEYSPLEIKRAITGYGRAEKIQIQKMIELFFKSKAIFRSHEADALAVAVCHINSKSFENRISRSN